MSEGKDTPWREDRASAALTHRPTKHIATMLEHWGASGLAEPSALLEKKGASKTKHMHMFPSPNSSVEVSVTWSKFLLF